MKHPDWRRLVRRRLPDLECSPEHEAELVEELAQILEDASRGQDFGSPAAVDAWLEREIPRWAELAQHLSAEPEPKRPLPLFAPTTKASSAPQSRPAAVRLRLTFDAAFSHLRYALRRLAQKPGFTATAVLSLAIGIGANAAIFSLVNAILLRDVPLKEPSRLVNVYLETPDFPYGSLSYPDYDDLAAGSSEIFEAVLVSKIIIGQTERDGAIETIVGEAVTGNYFQALGVEAHVGRTLLPEDDVAPGAHPVVVLGYSYWRSRYAADPQVVGESLRLAGREFEIVGVAPESYPGNMRGLVSWFYAPRMMVNIIQGNDYDDLQARGNHSLFAKARLRPGVSIIEAQTVVEGIADHVREQDLESWDPQGTFYLLPTSEVLMYPPLDRFVRAAAWLLTAVVGLVLLMACTNLAGFLLAQAVDRKKEISLRLALGATRRNLVAQLLSESLLLSAFGGVAGLVVAVGLLRALVGIDLPIPIPIELDLDLDLRVLGFTMGISLLAGLVLGLVPALQSTRPDLASTLKEEGAGGGKPGKLMLRNGLIGLQVATSTVLLVGAGLFLRSLQETYSVDPGFGRDPAAVMTMLVSGNRFDEDQGRRYVEQLTQRFEQIPGVEDVGFISNLFLNALSTTNGEFNVDGLEPPPERYGHPADQAIVDPGFFAAAGVRIVRGRNFNEHDRADTLPVAIISEALAGRFFPGVDPTGRYLRLQDGDLLIVGVANDTKVRTLGEAPRSFIYQAYSQSYAAFLTVVARTSRDPSALAVELLSTARTFDPDFWAWETKTMERHIGAMLLPAQMSAVVLSAFAVIALALAAIGLFGIVSYSVSQRTREIGIRMSLGADSAQVIRMLMATGLRPVFMGSFAGLVASVLVSRLVAGLLFGVSTLDLWTFLGTTLVLAATAMVASWLPARRVSRVSPVSALHFE